MKTTKFEEKTVEFRFGNASDHSETDLNAFNGTVPENSILRILQPIFRVSRRGSLGSTVVATDTYVIRYDDSLAEADFDGII